MATRVRLKSGGGIKNPKCNLCGLSETAKTVCLMGQGPVPSDIMIIGEAPGYCEDDVGKPFQGRAGQVMDEMLGEVGLKRDNIYITNAVRCHPPDNRTPTRKEITSCGIYLIREIARVKPKFVLILGAVALMGALKKGGVTKHRGEVYEKDGIKYFVTLHPAALFRQPQQIPYVRADFQRFSNLVNGKIDNNLEGFNWNLVDSPAKLRICLSSLVNDPVISFDIESSGLNPLAPGFKIFMIGFGTEGKQWIVPFDYPGSPFTAPIIQQKVIASLKKALDNGQKIVGQNGKYDIKCILATYGWRVPQTFDTMLASYILDENAPHGLKPMSKMFFNAPDYDIPKPIDTDRWSLKQVAEYCAMDVYYTRRLYFLQREQLLEDKALLRVFKELIMPASNALVDVELNGVYVDPVKYQEALIQIGEKVTEQEKALLSYQDINWNSTQQISKYLFGDLKLEVLERTEKGAPSTNSESVLSRLRDAHPVIPALISYREQIKLKQFLVSWGGFLDNSSRMYPTVKLIGTVTGRLSNSDPNLQQVPRDILLRSLITAPEGWELLEADYSQVELRGAAMLSGDRTMKMAYQAGEDIHKKTASAVMGVPTEKVEKADRKKAKAVNFGFIYGMGFRKFQEYARDKYGVDLTLDEAQEFRTRFFELYEDLQSWHERQRRLVRKYGYVRSPFGRKRRLPGIFSPDKKVRGEAERQSINSPNQSFASDLNLFSFVRISRELPGDKIRPVGLIHDALLAWVRKGCLDEIVPKVKEIMTDTETIEKIFKMTIPVPIEVDIKIGPWGLGKEYQKPKTLIKVKRGRLRKDFFL